MLDTFWRVVRFALQARLRGDAGALRFARHLVWELDGRVKSYAVAGPLRLPAAPLHKLLPDDELAIRIRALRSEDGGTEPYESFCVAAIARHVQPGCVFEFGTFRGQTTALLAQNTPPATRIFTLDVDSQELRSLGVLPTGADRTYIRKDRIGEHIAHPATEERVTQLLGDSLAFDYTPYLGRCELVFVDAGHGYESVKSDTENAFRLLAPGGVIMWHDYKPGCPGVVRALHECTAQHDLRHIIDTSLVVHGLPREAPTQRTSAHADAQTQPVSI